MEIWGGTTRKHSVVVPIPKPGKPDTSPSNLLHISLTSNLCKIIKRMVQAKLTWYTESKAQFHPRQTEFRTKLCAQDSLANICEAIEFCPETGEPRTLVALDTTKAFDSVSHGAVLERLQTRGITGCRLQFVQSFLEEGTFQGQIGKTGPETNSGASGSLKGGSSHRRFSTLCWPTSPSPWRRWRA